VAVAVLDTSVLIGFLDTSDANHDGAVAALAAFRGYELILPASAYAELLVGPNRHGPDAVGKVEQCLVDLALRIEPLTPEIARKAAVLRARHRALKGPDALVLATGDVLDASAVLTADRGWPKVSRRARPI
jgi:predicted nucleic acid-binding protein